MQILALPEPASPQCVAGYLHLHPKQANKPCQPGIR